jgi:general nucleoside transport system permease protein
VTATPTLPPPAAASPHRGERGLGALRRALRGAGTPLLALLGALLVGGVLIAAVGDDPFAVYGLLFGSALSWPDGVGYTLFYATPLVFTGLAVMLAFRAGLFNIGAEGQLQVAAVAAAAVGIGGATWSAWLLAPLACLAAVGAGAAWGALAGGLKARYGAHEVVTTILLNLIAAALAAYVTQCCLRQAGDPILESAPIGAGAHIARLGALVPGVPARLPLNLTFVAALAACGAVQLLLWHTRWGFELRATGASAAAASYGGIATSRQVVLALALSGGLAGMAAINEVLGFRYRYYDGFSPGYGFTGIAVALLGRNRPAGVLAAALLFGAMVRGSLFVGIFSGHVSRDLVLVLEGLAIFFVAALRRPLARRLRGGEIGAAVGPPPQRVESR